MEKKQMYAAVAAVVVVIIVVAAGVWYMTSNNGGSNESSETGDSYYFYLDGMEDLNGWYTAQGSDAEVALKAALDEAGIEYNISNGWVSSIGECIPGVGDKYIGSFVYTSNTTDNAYQTYFGTGPALNQANGNIVYLTYSTYTFVDYTMSYDLNPYNTTSDLMTTGPFATA